MSDARRRFVQPLLVAICVGAIAYSGVMLILALKARSEARALIDAPGPIQDPLPMQAPQPKPSSGYTFTKEQQDKLRAEAGDPEKFIKRVSMMGCTLIVTWKNGASTFFTVDGQACEDAKAYRREPRHE